MKYVIVANGPFLPKKIIVEAIGQSSDNNTDKKVVIALDGASNKLAAIGIKPDVVLGDFDSVTESASEMAQFWGIKETKKEIENKYVEPYTGKYNVEIVPSGSQEATDLQKAIDYCVNKNAESIEIVCATGGRMDHHEANVRTLRKMYNPSIPIYMHTDFQTLEFVKDKTIIMKGEVGDYCGVLTAPDCKFISDDDGLAYSKNEDDGSPYKLSYAHYESTSNELKKSTASIKVMGEALVIHPGHLNSQREFFKQQESERFNLLAKQYQYILNEITIAEWKAFKQANKQTKLSQPSLFLTDKPRKQKEVLYVSHSKNQLNSSEIDSKILLSMTPNKLKKFSIFKQHYNNGKVEQNNFNQAIVEAKNNGEIKFYKKNTI